LLGFSGIADMDIYYLGQSCFRLKGKNTTVICDPFEPDSVGLKLPTQSADIVTVSHQHKDHNNIKIVKDVKKIIDGAGEYEIGGVSIIGIQAFHDKKHGEERGKNTVFIFEIDGIRIAHLGDLGEQLSDDQIDAMGDIDILLIPVGGEYTIGANEAVMLVQKIDPMIIIPMHYQLPENKDKMSRLASVDGFLKEVGMMVERLPKLSIKKDDLIEGQKVVVLEKK